MNAMVSFQPSAFLSGRSVAGALIAIALSCAPQIARAQVVALVNGAPITEVDISQRTKLLQLSTHKSLSRAEVLKELVNDHLKIFITKRYGMEPSDAEVDNAFAGMASRSRLTPQQMEQSMAARGLSPSTLKLKIRADVGWSQLVRGKFGSSLTINDTDIRTALKSRNEPEKELAGHVYTVYPITLVAARGANRDGRRQEAENLRSRFQSCAEGLKLARALRDVVVREPVKRASADLAPQLRELLDKMEIGKLTPPEVTAQGVEMFALCDRKDSNADSPAKRAVREELFTKRYEAESKKYLEEVRRQSMIEYR
jgi:peptidyl-prolyl cis-trans isomerase SurA